MDRFQNLGVIKNDANYDSLKLDSFLETIDELRRKVVWEKAPIIDLFNHMIPNFKHKETGKDLEGKM